MECSKCNSGYNVKNGFAKSKQRYKCIDCGYNYTVGVKAGAKPRSMKKAALHLYLEGLDFRSIGRSLGVSNVSVLNWIRSFGQEVGLLHPESKEIGVVELDEMHSYIGSKNHCWVWIVVDRYGKKFIDFVVGDRSNRTAQQL